MNIKGTVNGHKVDLVITQDSEECAKLIMGIYEHMIEQAPSALSRIGKHFPKLKAAIKKLGGLT